MSLIVFRALNLFRFTIFVLCGSYVPVYFVHLVGKLLRVSGVVLQADVVNLQAKSTRCIDSLGTDCESYARDVI